MTSGHSVVRRARPLLGTLVEIGVVVDVERPGARHVDADPGAAIAAAFARIVAVEARLSRFAAGSEIFRFNAVPAGERIDVGADTRRVLAAADDLRVASGGLFDASLGSGATGWRCDAAGLLKLEEGVRLDLGGIGKGYAVDRAVDALVAAGAEAGWVNAGGDLRVFGATSIPIDLRDEASGGVRRFATLADGAFATSRLGDAGHASVAAPECLWADALTKIVIASGDASHPLLERFGARAWLH
jgi:thiamine biosynthesis lipoprotein